MLIFLDFRILICTVPLQCLLMRVTDFKLNTKFKFLRCTATYQVHIVIFADGCHNRQHKETFPASQNSTGQHHSRVLPSNLLQNDCCSSLLIVISFVKRQHFIIEDSQLYYSLEQNFQNIFTFTCYHEYYYIFYIIIYIQYLTAYYACL